jgi:hypothetical protein
MPISSLHVISTKQYNIKPPSTYVERSPLINNIIKGFGLGAGSLMIHKAASVVAEKFAFEKSQITPVSSTSIACPGHSNPRLPDEACPSWSTFSMENNQDCTEKLKFILQHCNDNRSMYCDKLYNEYLDCLENKKKNM